MVSTEEPSKTSNKNKEKKKGNELNNDSKDDSESSTTTTAKVEAETNIGKDQEGKNGKIVKIKMQKVSTTSDKEVVKDGIQKDIDSIKQSTVELPTEAKAMGPSDTTQLMNNPGFGEISISTSIDEKIEKLTGPLDISENSISLATHYKKEPASGEDAAKNSMSKVALTLKPLHSNFQYKMLKTTVNTTLTGRDDTQIATTVINMRGKSVPNVNADVVFTSSIIIEYKGRPYGSEIVTTPSIKVPASAIESLPSFVPNNVERSAGRRVHVKEVLADILQLTVELMQSQRYRTEAIKTELLSDTDMRVCVEPEGLDPFWHSVPETNSHYWRTWRNSMASLRLHKLPLGNQLLTEGLRQLGVRTSEYLFEAYKTSQTDRVNMLPDDAYLYCKWNDYEEEMRVDVDDARSYTALFHSWDAVILAVPLSMQRQYSLRLTEPSYNMALYLVTHVKSHRDMYAKFLLRELLSLIKWALLPIDKLESNINNLVTTSQLQSNVYKNALSATLNNVTINDVFQIGSLASTAAIVRTTFRVAQTMSDSAFWFVILGMFAYKLVLLSRVNSSPAMAFQIIHTLISQCETVLFNTINPRDKAQFFRWVDGNRYSDNIATHLNLQTDFFHEMPFFLLNWANRPRNERFTPIYTLIKMATYTTTGRVIVANGVWKMANSPNRNFVLKQPNSITSMDTSVIPLEWQMFRHVVMAIQSLLLGTGRRSSDRDIVDKYLSTINIERPRPDLLAFLYSLNIGVTGLAISSCFLGLSPPPQNLPPDNNFDLWPLSPDVLDNVRGDEYWDSYGIAPNVEIISREYVTLTPEKGLALIERARATECLTGGLSLNNIRTRSDELIYNITQYSMLYFMLYRITENSTDYPIYYDALFHPINGLRAQWDEIVNDVAKFLKYEIPEVFDRIEIGREDLRKLALPHFRMPFIPIANANMRIIDPLFTDLLLGSLDIVLSRPGSFGYCRGFRIINSKLNGNTSPDSEPVDDMAKYYEFTVLDGVLQNPYLGGVEKTFQPVIVHTAQNGTKTSTVWNPDRRVPRWANTNNLRRMNTVFPADYVTGGARGADEDVNPNRAPRRRPDRHPVIVPRRMLNIMPGPGAPRLVNGYMPRHFLRPGDGTNTRGAQDFSTGTLMPLKFHEPQPPLITPGGFVSQTMGMPGHNANFYMFVDEWTMLEPDKRQWIIDVMSQYYNIYVFGRCRVSAIFPKSGEHHEIEDDHVVNLPPSYTPILHHPYMPVAFSAFPTAYDVSTKIMPIGYDPIIVDDNIINHTRRLEPTLFTKLAARPRNMDPTMAWSAPNSSRHMHFTPVSNIRVEKNLAPEPYAPSVIRRS